MRTEGPIFDFRCNLPRYNGFNPSMIYGRVARNIKVKDPKFSQALQAMAAGSLYHVIVADNKCAGELMKLNQQFMCTYIPLNVIQSKVLPRPVVEQIQKLSNGKAHLALDLITYPPAVKGAIERIFGDTFVCENSDICRMITYSREKIGGFKTVNLKGDKYANTGEISGGSMPSKNANLLERVAKVMDLEKEKHRLNEESGEIRSKIESMRDQISRAQMADSDLKHTERELTSL